MYDAGTILRYGTGHEDDCYGGMGQASLLYGSDEEWSRFEMARDEFEWAWNPNSE
jgi:hypothetical protein